MNERAKVLKSRRNLTDLVKKGNAMIKSVDSVFEVYRETILSILINSNVIFLQSVTSCFTPKLNQIACVIGSSIFNPKDIFILDWSLWNDFESDMHSSEREKLIKQNQATLFRLTSIYISLFIIHFILFVVHVLQVSCDN